MRFSIITVTKNNKAGLLRAIECVRNQTYHDVEHIIVDGGSTDGSVELLRDIQSAGNQKLVNSKEANETILPTTYYSLLTISEADSGIYDAINKGIKLATGDVIGLLHSDDLYADENVIAEYANIFVKKGVEAVYSDLVYVKAVNSEQKIVNSKKGDHDSPSTTNYSPLTTNYSLLTTNYSIVRYWKAHPEKVSSKQGSVNSEGTDHYSPFTNHSLRFGWMPPHPTLFVKKSVFEKYGLYRTDMKIAADYEMILRLFWKHKISASYLPHATYLMSIGGASNKSLSNILLKSKEDLLALKLHNFPHPLITLLCKNLRKLPQFLARDL